MSASLDIHGTIDNCGAVKSFLFETEISPQADLDDVSEDWTWNDDNEQDSKQRFLNISSSNQLKNENTWAQECIVAGSPMGDILSVCRLQKAMFFAGDWNSRSRQMKYSKQFQGNVSVEGEKITSACCIPLISKKKSSPGGPDWTCIILGFSDGYVRMYTENGTLLISQMFHDQPVASIKCRSYQPSAINSVQHDQLEEIYIMYKTVLVTIDGFGLFQTLRACRNRMARLQANAEEYALDPPPLSYKKWQYESEQVTDCENIGVQTPSTFDHLLTASVFGGFHAKPNKIPYTSTVCAVTGEKPYISFNYAQEGQAAPYLSDIAYAVASKLKSSILNAATGWLGFGGTTSKPVSAITKPEKPKIEPATLMAARFGLPDKDRKGQSIVISPCHKLSAVTDTLGRVVLIDNDRGIAVRMWKGYREAQCTWLLVDDDMNSKTRITGRKALYLVIYAPRRGQLEVFSMQQGPKVASFSCSKYGKLLRTPYGMMGLNNIPVKGGNNPCVQCLFLDHEAQVFTLHVPFHLALGGRSNTKLKEMHLLKSLQRMLRDSQYSSEEINLIIYDLTSQPMINQSFKIVIQYCKNTDVMMKVFESYLEKFCDDDRRDLSLVFRFQSLLHMHNFLIKAIDLPPPYSGQGEEGLAQDNTVLMCLHATEKEIKLVKDMANKEIFNKSSSKTVSFQDDRLSLPANEFLTMFDIEYDPAKLKISSNCRDNVLNLNKNNENLPKFGQLLFGGCFNSSVDLKEWEGFLKNCDLVPSELVLEVLKYWCSNALSSGSFIEMMGKLYNVVRTLCNLKGVSSIVMSETSSWWDTIRKEIAHSCKIFYIYTFSIVCRAVSIDIQQETEKGTSDEKLKSSLQPINTTENIAHSSSTVAEDIKISNDEDSEDWENVSLDMIRWNILLKQIEDLSFLITILTQRPPLSNPTLPSLPTEIEEMSVVSLLEKGTGCIAEMVGRWLTTIGIDPSLVVDDSEIDAQDVHISPEYTEKELKQRQKLEKKTEVNEEHKMLEKSANSNSEVSYIIELLHCLKENFPVSLNSSIIISNYCWEYCLAWNQNVENVHYLASAISCSKSVPSNFIKQGLMSMMWSTFISKQLENIISKGKTRGNEKFVEKVVGISDHDNKVAFLNACVKFFDNFLETSLRHFGVPQPKTISRKTHWNNEGAASASLTDLALLQPLANYDMLLLHYQVSMTGLFVYNFNIKKASMRPIRLFSTKDSLMFFTTLNTRQPYANSDVDFALKILRNEFLCLIVTNAIDKISEELESSGDDECFDSKYITPSQTGVQECEKWLNMCFELGRIWNLDLDGLKINQVCEYYSSGFDFLGLETIGTVAARDILGSKLLVLAGMRLQYIIQANRDTVTEMVSSLSTNLSNWINKLDYTQLRCLRFPKVSIRDIIQQVMQLIPESSYDYSLAEDMLVGISFLN